MVSVEGMTGFQWPLAAADFDWGLVGRQIAVYL
jgi:hypothetical protein